MSWFKVDDKLPDNRKTRTLRKSHPTKRRDASAFGIWTLAGAWSNDGWVPLEILEDWDDDAEALAERLVRAGLWHRADRAGEPGFVFHDWHDQNPANGDNDPSTSGTFGNHVRWHVQRNIVADDCDHCPKEPDEESIGANRGDIGAIKPDDRGDDRGHRGESLPSRPDPTPIQSRPEPETLLSDTSDDTGDPIGFDAFWDTYGNKVGRAKCVVAYRRALKKPGVTPERLEMAAANYVLFCQANDRYLKNPLTWLHGEHWNDELPQVRAPQTNTQSHLSLVQQLAAEQEQQQQHLREIGGGR